GESARICSKGLPVAKIIDNLSPLLICLRASGLPPETVKKGGSLAIIWEGREVSGRVTELGTYPGGMQVVIETLIYPQSFLNIRKISPGVVGGRVKGFIVPAGALVSRDGRQGIYIMNKEDMKWVPVKVEGTVNGSAAVSGDQLAPGVRCVLNPRWLILAGS
ncbi:MAG: HlyD family efflux transporter periplasmic adaptor subunit, partial [Desulfocucumaceae bacterium]